MNKFFSKTPKPGEDGVREPSVEVVNTEWELPVFMTSDDITMSELHPVTECAYAGERVPLTCDYSPCRAARIVKV